MHIRCQVLFHWDIEFSIKEVGFVFLNGCAYLQLEQFLNSLIFEDNPERGNKVEPIISESFDPSWLVELAEKEYPEEKEIRTISV